MRQVVRAIGGDQLFEHALVLPLGKLGRERGAHAPQPLLVASGRQSVGRESMVIAVENETHRVDQGAVEIEQEGSQGSHARKLARRAPIARGGRAFYADRDYLGGRFMQPTELVALMAAIIYSGRREGEGPH